MYLSYDKFKKVFDDYCKKAEKHQAAWIQKDSWKAIKDLLGQCHDQKEDISILFMETTDAEWKTAISPIYCSPERLVYLPNQLKQDIEAAYISNTIRAYPISSCCTDYMPSMAKDDHNPILSTVLVNESSVRDLIEDQCSTTQGAANGTVILNPTTGSLSYVYDGQLNEIASAGIYFSTPETNNKEKENDTMNIPTMKFDFGPANPEAVSMSPYGLAVRCGDSWYAYNASEGQTIDVTGLTFSFKNAIYKMPVAVNQVKEGDLIVHQKKAMYVVQVNDKTSIEVVDLAASEQKTVIPVSNMFGFNYVTKVAPLFNLGNITPSAENPFGNILPMMMMSSMFEDDKNNKSEGNDFMQMMLMMSLMNGTNPFNAMFAGAGPQAE